MSPHCIEHLIDNGEAGTWARQLPYLNFPVFNVRTDGSQWRMIDPLIQQARTVNDLGAFAQRLEANLAKRRALRDQPHKRGHMTRRGVGG